MKMNIIIKPRTQLRQQIKIIPRQRQNQQIIQNPQIQKAQSQLIIINLIPIIFRIIIKIQQTII